MFSVNHFIWIAVCAVITAVTLPLLLKYRPPLDKVLTVCCIVCVLSELVKVFGTVTLVPSADGEVLYPYLETKHLPFHLCSLQIILIFFVKFAKESRLRTAILGFMYPTCTLGAFFALLLPSLFSESISVSQAFTHPLAYQTFLYHAMLLILGIYIIACGQVKLRARHYYSTLGILGICAFVSIYLNSVFASPVYVDGKLRSVEFVTNFFFTYKPPIPVTLTERRHWFLYLAILLCLAVVLIGALYIPVFIKEKKLKIEKG